VLLTFNDSDDNPEKKKSTKNTEINVMSLLILLMAPILIAIGNITLRTLRSLNEYTTGTYIAVCGIPVFGLTVAFSDEGF